MGLFENCPNCGAKTFDGGFCSSCKPKRETVFWETGVEHDRFNTQSGELDRKLTMINIGKIMKEAEKEKKRKLEFLKNLDK